MVTVDLKALLERLNDYCKDSVLAAVERCGGRGNYEVTIAHLLLQFVDDPSHDFQCILRHVEIDPSHMRRTIQSVVEKAPIGNSLQPTWSPLVLEWLQDAWLFASIDLHLSEIRSGTLILALVANLNRYAHDVYSNKLKQISAEALRRNFFTMTAGSQEELSRVQPEKTTVPEAGEAPADDTALGRFTTNFTGKARAGEIDPVFCRDREISLMIDILERRRKNNPIAVGEAGVGKTAVVEGLALKIVQGDVPDALKGVEVYGLDLGLLEAGASIRGEFENRIKGVIAEVKASPKPIILFIDEAHMLIGAGGAAGGGDAANLLKPALARGESRTIAATTWSEYKKYFEKDAALERRFQVVHVAEPSAEETVVILRGLRDTYETAHGVYVRDDAITAAANLSARYISGRQLPDKAVDLLDTASARVKISMSARPDALDDLQRRIQTLEREREAVRRDIMTGNGRDDGRVAELDAALGAIRGELTALESRWQREREAVARVLNWRRQLAEKSAPLEGQETEADTTLLRQELDAAMAELERMQGTEPLLHFQVTPDIVSKVVSDWTGIPVGNMVKDEAEAILRFPDSLKQRIKGQDHAIAAIGHRIRTAKAGLSIQPHTPIGVFLFVGPSGVGKTECALGVAELLFGGERFVITINMSEFQEKHTVSRLIGSPPGYVGYGEGGVLTEAVRQRPYAVVLLDEVEKADREVLNVFYQVFDKGMLADGEGRVIDFKNTVICLTSNLAADLITKRCMAPNPPKPETIVAAIRPVLSAHFGPALLARMDIVPFYPIARNVMTSVVELKLRQLGERLHTSQKMRLTYDAQVVEQIAARCTEVETGARNIDHIMRGTLLPEISTRILQAIGTESVPHTLELGIDAAGGFTYRFLTEKG